MIKLKEKLLPHIETTPPTSSKVFKILLINERITTEKYCFSVFLLYQELTYNEERPSIYRKREEERREISKMREGKKRHPHVWIAFANPHSLSNLETSMRWMDKGKRTSLASFGNIPCFP